MIKDGGATVAKTGGCKKVKYGCTVTYTNIVAFLM